MRSDLDLFISSTNLVILRIGERFFKLQTKDPEQLKLAFDELKKNRTPDNNLKKQLFSLLNKYHSFSNSKDAYTLLNTLGLNLPALLNGSTKPKIGVIGDDDLIHQYGNFNTRWDFINLNKFPTEKFDIGVLLQRKFNYKLALQNNELLFKRGLPYISLLFSPLKFELGPETIPHQTSCLNCKRLWELKNITDGALISLFDASNQVSHEYILEENYKLAFGLLDLQILYTLLNLQGFNIELGLAQKVLEFDFTKGNIVNHNLLKNPQCSLCFEDCDHSTAQTFEV